MTGTEKSLIVAFFRNKWKKWDSLKPPKSHHCRTWNACIAKMDHHCPWVNNWVGISNQKTFLLFWLYIWLGAIYTMFVACYYNYPWLYVQCEIFRDPLIIIINIFGLFIALLFCMFTIIMFWDQLSWIMNNTSTIDKMKKTINKKVKFLI